MNLLDLLKSVVEKLGLRIEEPNVQPPQGFDWVRDIVAQAGNLRVVVRATGTRDRMILVMPIGFSELHRKMIQLLPAEERVKLVSRVLQAVASICPECRVGLGGTPVTPQGVVAEIHYVEKPGEQRLADDITRLLNVYLVVNAVLWEKFPALAPTQQPQLYT